MLDQDDMHWAAGILDQSAVVDLTTQRVTLTLTDPQILLRFRRLMNQCSLPFFSVGYKVSYQSEMHKLCTPIELSTRGGYNLLRFKDLFARQLNGAALTGALQILPGSLTWEWLAGFIDAGDFLSTRMFDSPDKPLLSRIANFLMTQLDTAVLKVHFDTRVSMVMTSSRGGKNFCLDANVLEIPSDTFVKVLQNILGASERASQRLALFNYNG